MMKSVRKRSASIYEEKVMYIGFKLKLQKISPYFEDIIHASRFSGKNIENMIASKILKIIKED